MKLILAIIGAADELDTVEELNSHGYMVTKLSTSGGFLIGLSQSKLRKDRKINAM